MKRNHLLFVLLLVLMVTLLPSCSGKTQSEKLTKLELEFTVTTTTDESGTAVFSERTYSKGKEILVRGYTSSDRYSYVTDRAKIYAESITEETREIKSGFRFLNGEMYQVWAECDGLKSEPQIVSGYGVGELVTAKYGKEVAVAGTSYADLKKHTTLKQFTAEGSIHSFFAPERVVFLQLNGEESFNLITDKPGAVLKKTDPNGKAYTYLAISASEEFTTFSLQELKVVDESDTNRIFFSTSTLYDAAGKLDFSSIKTSKLYNTTRIKDNVMATVDGTVQADFTITITKDGKEVSKFVAGDTAEVPTESGTYYMTIEYKNNGVSVTPTSKSFKVK